MTAPEITAMLESLYRVRGGAIDFERLRSSRGHFSAPMASSSTSSISIRDELWRRGRAVGAVVDGRLYLILFDAARSHYYANAIGDFEALTASARRRR